MLSGVQELMRDAKLGGNQSGSRVMDREAAITSVGKIREQICSWAICLNTIGENPLRRGEAADLRRACVGHGLAAF